MWAEDTWPTKPDAAGRIGIPTGIKVLGVLRVLGRALHFDDIAELAGSDFSAETFRTFFHVFVAKFVEEFWDKEVHPPNDEETLRTAMAMFDAAGLTGAFGSTDGVHVRWDRAPHAHKHVFKGSKGYPSLSYSVTVGHNMFIYTSTKGFTGNTNDLTASRWDNFLQAVHSGMYGGQVEYKLYNADGELITMKGVWLLCDGGYHKWPRM